MDAPQPLPPGQNGSDWPIAGRSVLVTGGSGGIGLAVAEAFARLGKRVWLAGRNRSATDDLCTRYPDVRFIEVDMGDAQQIESTLGPLLRADDAPEILVNGVGVSPKNSPSGERWTSWTMPLEHWRQVMAVNLDSVFLSTALALPAMIERRYGRVINIASLVARTSGGGVAPLHYVTSKTALLGLTRATAQEVGAHGITVNAVSPGRIDTPMIHDVPESLNQQIAQMIPLRRLGRPMDVAGAVLFFASAHADYITGATLDVNGGMHMA